MGEGVFFEGFATTVRSLVVKLLKRKKKSIPFGTLQSTFFIFKNKIHNLCSSLCASPSSLFSLKFKNSLRLALKGVMIICCSISFQKFHYLNKPFWRERVEARDIGV